VDEHWEIIFVQEVHDWYQSLLLHDLKSAELVDDALELLQEKGPSLRRPIVDTISGSALSNLKELRPGSTGRSEIRLLFVFDPQRQAIILVAGDKSGEWNRWYRTNIPLAELRYRQWIDGEYDEVI
jgi:hypothetical protein